MDTPTENHQISHNLETIQSDSTCTQEGVNNTVKGGTQNTNESNNNVKVHSPPFNPQKPKLRRSER